MSLFDRQIGGAASALLPAVRLQLHGDIGQQYFAMANSDKRTWTWSGANALKQNNPRLWTWDTAKNDHTWTWNNASHEPVAYSVQLEPLVIADYAGDGSVRGIEFLRGPSRTLGEYIRLAQQKSRGAVGQNGALLPAVRSG